MTGLLLIPTPLINMLYMCLPSPVLVGLKWVTASVAEALSVHRKWKHRMQQEDDVWARAINIRA